MLTYSQIKDYPSILDILPTKDIPVCCSKCSIEIPTTKNKLKKKIKSNHIGIYCSDECRFLSYKKPGQTEVECKTCKTLFMKRNSEMNGKNNFCSCSCSAKFNNIGVRRHPYLTCVCKKCDVEYIYKKGTNNKKICEKCIAVFKNKDYYKSLSLNSYHELPSVKAKHPSWKNSHIRQFCRSWNADLVNLPCQKCAYSLHTELCHIKPVSTFELTDTIGEINDPSNIVVLCRNCHWEFDNGHLSLDDIPERILSTPYNNSTRTPPPHPPCSPQTHQ